MHENRETSETSTVKPGSRSAGEGDCRTARADVSEESHSGILPMNYSNNDKTSSAENREGRPLIKENAGQPNTHSTQSGERVSQGLAGVRKAAREHKEMKFTAFPPLDRQSAAGKLLFVKEESSTRSGRGYLVGV
jgi:RNA-directed DNA polymerase